MMNKSKVDVVSWDWKDQPPYRLLGEAAKKYKHSYETCLGSDQYYVFFSDFVIKDDCQADELYVEMIELDCK